MLDVRTNEEVAENGHIEEAINIPLNELAQNIDKLPDFDTPIVAYCGRYWRATIAMTALNAMGWTDVKAHKSTFQDWVDAGSAVSEGPAPEAMVLDVANPDPDALATVDESLSTYGVIDAESLNTALVENPDLIVIDVRKTDELVENGIIDTGDVEQIHIPLEEFIALKDKWPAGMDASIVVHCGSGHRSIMAMTMLWVNGYTDVKSLKGGFTNWATEEYPVVEYATP